MKVPAPSGVEHSGAALSGPGQQDKGLAASKMINFIAKVFLVIAGLIIGAVVGLMIALGTGLIEVLC